MGRRAAMVQNGRFWTGFPYTWMGEGPYRRPSSNERLSRLLTGSCSVRLPKCLLMYELERCLG